VNLRDWIDELMDTLDVEIDVDEALVLDVAKDAGRNVDGSAEPITAFLLGYAAAASAGNPDELERLAAAASDLALRWDKSPEAIDADVDFEIEIEDELEAAEA
jgi:hypothetical protein